MTGVRAYAGFVSVLLIGQIVTNNGDVLIAKVFLPPDDAGLYSAVALVGRAVFFLSWSVATVVFPAVAAGMPSGQATHRPCSVAASSPCWRWDRRARSAPAGRRPVLGVVLGPDYAELSVRSPSYAAATTLFAVGNLIASHHLATGRIAESWLIARRRRRCRRCCCCLARLDRQLIRAQLVAMAVLLIAVATSHLLAGAGPPAGPPHGPRDPHDLATERRTR